MKVSLGSVGSDVSRCDIRSSDHMVRDATKCFALFVFGVSFSTLLNLRSYLACAM